jgi:hypothetical protein
MPAKKHARYTLRYHVILTPPSEGLRKWWRDHHRQDETTVVRGGSYEDAWYTLVLLHDDWGPLRPEIQRRSAKRRTR